MEGLAFFLIPGLTALLLVSMEKVKSGAGVAGGSDGDGPGGAGGNSDAEYEVAQSYYGYEVGGEVARKLPLVVDTLSIILIVVMMVVMVSPW